MPFVYYGEEIGMTGAKPDERLRTPMQWSAARGGGFTSGAPWERFADDSVRTTVAAQDDDSTSLLNLYRRLIHLRDDNSALSGGTIVPLTASNDAVAAYLRQDGKHTVLVLANLGRTPLDGVSLSTTARVLPAGRWMLRDMLGGSIAAPLRIAADGRISGYRPLPALPPTTGYLFELVTSTR
jgi:alpha-amylase